LYQPTTAQGKSNVRKKAYVIINSETRKDAWTLKVDHHDDTHIHDRPCCLAKTPARERVRSLPKDDRSLAYSCNALIRPTSIQR
jgi:hypothetical protein